MSASLFIIFYFGIKGGGGRRGTHNRGGIFQTFEVGWSQDLFTLESFSKLGTHSLNIIRPGFMFIVFSELSIIL